MHNVNATKIRTTKKYDVQNLSAALAAVAAIAAVVLSIVTVVVPSLTLGRSDGVGSSSDSTGTGTSNDAVVSDDSEVRGVFIASAYNINYPSKMGLSASELRLELDDIISTCLEANINTIYFQVRPSADALYRSNIFPTSEFLTGVQGAPLTDGFDPLEYLVAAAHTRGIAVHAWVNPLRVTVGSAASPRYDTALLAEGHPVRENPEYAIAYADGRLYFDCGNPDVRELIADGVAEIVRGYDIDGVIFDDYFYPYPTREESGTIAAFDDSVSFAKYGGGMTLDDWRRDNVNKMIERCYNAIKSVRSDCEFGVAPFGIWQNDDGTNGGSQTSGLESYSAIYCDPTAWVSSGYIDYIAPQIYWRFTNSVARYDVLVRWWSELVDGTGVELLISHGVYNYDTWEAPENELREQVEFARAESAYRGSILYGYAALKANVNGLFEEAREVFGAFSHLG